ncbi:hypothetical protein Moror_8635 [Moniliophthora roreri MCA 2997]|uniref:Uncharacterized protein n=1 Tax=Moniliophthora roreri (strain MCA 2997) TaxID=1381753 RepID=V2XAZ6_MONRO|nr:hypothetical protein Moror_8635 [Moniliophthora roreri MCA 2997]
MSNLKPSADIPLHMKHFIPPAEPGPYELVNGSGHEIALENRYKTRTARQLSFRTFISSVVMEVLTPPSFLFGAPKSGTNSSTSNSQSRTVKLHPHCLTPGHDSRILYHDYFEFMLGAIGHKVS